MFIRFRLHGLLIAATMISIFMVILSTHLRTNQSVHMISVSKKKIRLGLPDAFTSSVLAEAISMRDSIEKLLETEDNAWTKAKAKELRNSVNTFLSRTKNIIAKQSGVSLQLKQLDVGDKKANFSCPEIYKGSTYGYPYFRKGFETLNCTKIPINRSVSVIITENEDITESKVTRLRHVVGRIRVKYPGIHILLLSNGRLPVMELRDLNMSVYRPETIDESPYQGVFTSLNTLFVLFLQSPVTFDDNIDLERLIRVMTQSVPGVVAVGGAVKSTRTGQWTNACLQTKLSNYIFDKQSGYYRSINECLVCDSLEGPFLTRLSTLRAVPVKENVGAGIFDEWFWRIKVRKSWEKSKFTVLSCPDVMFQQELTIQDRDLKPLADELGINQIIEPDGQIRWYGCRQSTAFKESMCVWKAGMAVPPCCLANLADAIKFFMAACEKNNITCELQEGTLLGAVKFGYVLPWERDADLTFLTADFEKLKALKQEFMKNGYAISVISEPWCCVDQIKAGGVFRMTAYSWNIEIYGQHKMDSHELRQRGEEPTKLRFDDMWVYSPENPGQASRNRYGKEIYRHAEHWLTTGHESGWDPYNSGRFESCPQPGHHGCLDQYDADGNIQFQRRLSKNC